MSKVYSFKTVQHIPVTPEAAWTFFSDPANLTRITPGGMGFKVISSFQGNRIYAGQVIEYKVSPLWGIPLYWMTEITHADEGKYFVDEQRFGPYSFWHHQHHFKIIEGGVEMTDIVHYKIPFWFLGGIMHALYVKKKLKGIFDYRYKKIEELFGLI
jgi:ligand-binding SRPBCC domain-containing protein